MSNEIIITSRRGKQYNGLRAYHIAMGHAVRQALIDFSKEIVEKCQEKISNFYSTYDPVYYDRTHQLIDKMELGELVKTNIKGNFQGNSTFEIDVFDWEVLDARMGEIGMLNSYSDFYGGDSREEVESYFSNGIYGHDPLNLRTEIDEYVKENLQRVVDNAINNF